MYAWMRGASCPPRRKLWAFPHKKPDDDTVQLGLVRDFVKYWPNLIYRLCEKKKTGLEKVWCFFFSFLF